jgi:tetraacyldisaccharide 4'-kinase
MSGMGAPAQRTPRRRGTRPLAWLLGRPYALALGIRRWAYRRGLLNSHSVDAPVFSVGNITVGGTGKTPMVAWLVDELRKLGRSPAVLTRGYKARNGQSDEAELLRQRTGAYVVVQPDRYLGALRAVANDADALVMDDGFQHRRLRRNLDIVLIDATNPFGSGPIWRGYCLPLGRLRESLLALRDANVIVLTRADLMDPAWVAALEAWLHERFPEALLASAVHKPTAAIAPDGTRHPPETLAGKPVVAFCGLGNPMGFAGTLAQLDVDLRATIPLKDHVHYDERTLAMLAHAARQAGADRLVTTCKDAVKFDPASVDVPIWQLAVDIALRTGREEVLEKIADCLYNPRHGTPAGQTQRPAAPDRPARRRRHARRVRLRRH